jgi:hypothetical protein
MADGTEGAIEKVNKERVDCQIDTLRDFYGIR